MSKIYESEFCSGHDGSVMVDINGKRLDAGLVQTATAQITFSVSSSTPLGARMTQHAARTAEGTGNGTFHIDSPIWLELTMYFKNNGHYPPITIQLYNENKGSRYGRQEVILSTVIFSSATVAKVDATSDDSITFDSDFTFDDIEPVEKFNYDI